MHKHCTRVGDLTKAEIDVIKSHLEKHKWYRGIQNDEEALMSFNEEFGPILRDMYCRYGCPDREDCEVMLKGRKKNE